METIINEDTYLNREYYKKVKLDIIKYGKRKKNTNKFPLDILIIFLVIIISIILN